MDLAIVDRSAASGASPLHRTAPAAKLLAAALIVSAAIVTRQPLTLIALALALTSAVVAWRLPGRPIAALVAYPAVFAAVFALAAAPDLATGVSFVLRSATASLTVIVLMFTTPYPQVFAPLQRILPSLVGDALLVTYRSFFLLLQKFSHLLTAGRLRAGVSVREPLRSARIVVRSLGGVLLYSLDLSQRTYDVMRLRGYERRLRVAPALSESRARDAFVVGGGATLFALALSARIAPSLFGPAGVFAPALGLAALALALVVRWRSS